MQNTIVLKVWLVISPKISSLSVVPEPPVQTRHFRFRASWYTLQVRCPVGRSSLCDVFSVHFLSASMLVCCVRALCMCMWSAHRAMCMLYVWTMNAVCVQCALCFCMFRAKFCRLSNAWKDTQQFYLFMLFFSNGLKWYGTLKIKLTLPPPVPWYRLLQLLLR